MSDLIERQAAINAMCELMHHWFGGDPKDEIREIKRELEKLPSAQPEREYTMEEFMFGQDMGNPEDGSL